MALFAQPQFENLFTEVRVQAGPLCAILAILLIVVLSLGIVLRTACSSYNAICGGKDAADGVPMPTLFGSMVMMFLSFAITFAICLAASWLITNLAFASNVDMSQRVFYSGGAALLLYFVVLSVLLALFLPAPIFRAFLIAVLCVPVGIVLLILLVVVLWLITAALNISIPAIQQLPWKKG